MIINSFVAVPDGAGGFRGRYVHHDGYPAGVGAHLTKIVQRDGFVSAARILIEQNHCWSSVIANQEATPAVSGRSVPGYGVACTEGEDPHDHDFRCEWAYILDPGGITIWGRYNGVWEVQPISIEVP